MIGRLQSNLPAMIRGLFETRLDEMTRTGRYGKMKALLDEVIGPAYEVDRMLEEQEAAHRSHRRTFEEGGAPD